eukprot:gene7205-7419_t
MAAAMKRRPVADMSEGDRLRREAKLEHMRLLADSRSLDGVTFTPDMSPSRVRVGSLNYGSVGSRISLKGPGLQAYLASSRQRMEEARVKHQKEKMKEEMKECTFKPSTTPLPSYLSAGASVGYAAQFNLAPNMSKINNPQAVRVPTAALVASTQKLDSQHQQQMPDSSSVASSTQLTLEQRAQMLAVLGALQQRHQKHVHGKME